MKKKDMEYVYRDETFGLEPENIAMMVYYMRAIDLSRFFNKLGDTSQKHNYKFFMEKIDEAAKTNMNISSKKLIEYIANNEAIKFARKEDIEESDE